MRRSPSTPACVQRRRAALRPRFKATMIVGCALAALLYGASAHIEAVSAKEISSSRAEPCDAHSDGIDVASLHRNVESVVSGLRENQDGEVYAAAVEGTDPEHLIVAVARVDGCVFVVGDADARFPLMSVSKPFTYALALEQHGVEFMIDRIGVSATGFPYNAIAAGAVRRTTEQNPLVNAGAIATHAYIEGATPAEKTKAVVDLYSRMANRRLAVEEAWRVTPRALTYALAYQMQATERLEGDVEEVASRYLESNIVAVTAQDLAMMGATLANGGIQPITGERILARISVRTVLSAMVTAGMYEHSGIWWNRVGLPAKSGVSGAILAVAPGWGAIVAYSPRLDTAGNSVRGAIAIQQLVERWHLHTMDRLLPP